MDAAGRDTDARAEVPVLPRGTEAVVGGAQGGR
jgi:hypothetical protein